jgi:hypothetical protein
MVTPESSLSAGSGVAGVMVAVPMVMVSCPARALASSMAARNVQTPPEVAQTPLPGLASLASPLLLTVKAAVGAA